MPSTVKKRVTLYIDSQTYDKFREYCENEGLIVSKKIENFMKGELKKNVRDNQ